MRQEGFTHVLYLAFVTLALAAPGRAAIRYVKAGASGAPDGTSWATAYTSIQSALNAAQPGDEVWVARGVYPERVTLRAGMKLLGGFAGTETSSERSDPWAQPTVLDAAGRNGPAVTIPKEAPGTTVDGFTLTNGTGLADPFQQDVRGGGLHILGDNATVTRNIIRRNWLHAWLRPLAAGGGVYAEGVTLTLAGNVIQDNEAYADKDPSVQVWFGGTAEGGGVALINANVTVANNLIQGNAARFTGSVVIAYTPGSGLYASGCTGRITGNTIVANAGNDWRYQSTTYNGALYLEKSPSTLTVANNTVAFNAPSGVERSGDDSLFIYNNVFGNGQEYGGSDRTGQNGNISADPLFVDRANGNYHLLPGSPAIDAGDDGAVFGAFDLSGAPRILGARVDMGAYELDPTRPHIWHVKADAPSVSLDGRSWPTAFATIQAALDAARPGDHVWVARGTYTESLRMETPDVGLYGGFAGTETSREGRDPRAYVTTIGSIAGGLYAARVTLAAATGSLVDGFTIRDGAAGVICETGATAILSNNVITRNVRRGRDGGGVIVRESASVVIEGNAITENESDDGAGISSRSATVRIGRNVIARNKVDGTGPTWGGGILVFGGTAVIHDNLIAGNTVRAMSALPYVSPSVTYAMGGGIAGQGTLTIANNTIVGNIVTGDSWVQGAGLYIDGGTATVRNNILAGNRSIGGNYTGTPGPADFVFGGTVTFRTNLLFDNVPATTPAPEGNLVGDPLFVDPASGNYHLRKNSPAINAGDNWAIQGSQDLDGRPRRVPPAVDIGAYEDQTPPPFTISDVVWALRYAAGIYDYNAASRFNVVTDGASASRIDLLDAVRLARKAAGLDANP